LRKQWENFITREKRPRGETFVIQVFDLFELPHEKMCISICKKIAIANTGVYIAKR